MNGGKPLAGSHAKPVRTFEGHEDEITSITTFPDGKRIATGSVDKTIRTWKLEDGKELKKWQVSEAVGALIILRNGKYVVSVEGVNEKDFDKKVDWQLWVRNAETRKVVVAGPSDSHTQLVIALDISPDISWPATVFCLGVQSMRVFSYQANRNFLMEWQASLGSFGPGAVDRYMKLTMG